MTKDINGAEITIKHSSASPPAPHPLKTDWDAALSTDAKLAVIAAALGIK